MSNHYARCPTCGFEKTNIDADEARDLQYNGCPDCADSRGLGVSTMDNFPN